VLQVLNPRGKQAFETEDLEGFEAYSNLIATAIQKLRSIERMREQERIEREVSIAAEIQQELLSRAVPDEIPGALFASYNKAATDVGGDFFFVHPRSPYEIYFAIGDVSGKGMPASLLMAQTLSAMQFVFATTTSPANALSTLNSTLHNHIVRGMFVTLLVGRMTPDSRRVELASAGHCRPFVARAAGEPIEVLTEGALPLGVMPQVSYRQGKVELAPGDYLVCFTDGLSESRDPRTDRFFDEVLADQLRGPFASAQSIVDHLVAAEREHRDHTQPRDDLTLLVAAFR
jgi:sigma-B regulation protein RsbU (phosphoserine phosphatase)